MHMYNFSFFGAGRPFQWALVRLGLTLARALV
jgi:hypothetical protein